MPAYRTSCEHLFEELRRLDLALNLHIARRRGDPDGLRFNDFRGLFIAEEEIDRLVHSDSEQRSRDEQLEARLKTFAAAITDAERAITQNVAESFRQGSQLSLPRLAQLFSLSPFDVDALLICLAPELDLKYEKLYAYLQNDVTRKRPTADLILNLCCRSLDEKLQARTRLLSDAPLIKHELILAAIDPASEQTTLLSRALKIDERILNYLLGAETIDERLASLARVTQPQVELGQVLLPEGIKQGLANAFQRDLGSADRRTGKGATVFVLQGPDGSGKKFVTEALCHEVGAELLIADGPSLLSAGSRDSSLVARLFREARLRSAVVFIDQAEVLAGDGEKENQLGYALTSALGSFAGIVVAGSCDSRDLQWLSTYPRWVRFALPIPDFAVRKEIWRRALVEDEATIASDIDLDPLADRFNFTPGRIHSAVVEARRFASTCGGEARRIDANDLNQACRAQTGSRLPTLARKINPIFKWNDIILPSDCLGQLREVCAHVRHRQRVFSDWGFDGKISLGKGLGILFVGSSGTGKTMAAEIIAGELALDLYKIDLSGVVSKYIGETEKNLSRVFAEAEATNAVLFFDEADAIFGKRSEVKDSHDRYANIEINYLLQKMEEYEGIVVLASNFQKNIDEAFTRRLRFIIEFPFPEKDYRGRIWRKVFPANTPLASDIDFDFLAHKLKVSGGNIRNIALSAAFLAAANSGHVGMEHIVCAAKREFQKMGRLCVKSDFEQYFELIETEEIAS
jgi:SpoVK/Ycf46/Vps4 family AAA+-type ATPase